MAGGAENPQIAAPSMSENRELIEAAAAEIKARSSLELRVSAPENWREVDIQHPTGQVVVRLTPVGEDATNVEVFAYGALLLGERVRGYRSGARLAKLVEGIHRRALTPSALPRAH
jgi:hypothetical protein